MSAHPALGAVTDTFTKSFATVVVVACALLCTLPFWLPPYVIRLRMALFTRINGDGGLQIPNDTVGIDAFKLIYNHPAARLRSKQPTVGLSDLFWYFLCPGPDIHQEHVETGTLLHVLVSEATKALLAVPTLKLEALATKHAEARLAPVAGELGVGCPSWSVVRLRDYFFPMMARFFYELVFDEPCPEEATRLILASGQNVINALKCTELRDMSARNRLTQYIQRKLEGDLAAGRTAAPALAVSASLLAPLTVEERALYIQGVFFHTGCVQMSEALAHTCLALASYPQQQLKLMQDDSEGKYMDLFLTEVLRAWPLFGIAHRITSADIDLPNSSTRIPAGSVVCFNYPKFHGMGYDRPEEFNPDRWLTLSKKDCNYIPFGVARNRPCPAQRVSLLCLRAMMKVFVHRAQFMSSVSHDRSLPGRGLCLLIPRALSPSASASASAALPPQIAPPPAWMLSWLLWRMKAQDTVDALFRSVAQLVFGTYMVWDAKRQQLAWQYQHGHCPGRGAKPAYHSQPAPVGAYSNSNSNSEPATPH